jgi:hypothetical protein
LDEDTTPEQRQLLKPKEVEVYMSLVGFLAWITESVKPNDKFYYRVLSIRQSNPRQWNMYLAVFLMEHVYLKRKTPLILGGLEVDLGGWRDCSLGIFPWGRSAGGFSMHTCTGLGAFMTKCGSSGETVTDIFKDELHFVGECSKSMDFYNMAAQELMLPNKRTSEIHVDSKAAEDKCEDGRANLILEDGVNNHCDSDTAGSTCKHKKDIDFFTSKIICFF